MDLETAISRITAHAAPETNFAFGDSSARDDWERAQRRMGVRLPESWIRFATALGAGEIHVRAYWYYNHNHPSKAKPDRFFLGPPRSWREAGFQIELARPRKVEYAATWFGTIAEQWAGWCHVGGAGNGDYLLLRSDPSWTTSPRDGDIAWWNHECNELAYPWPTVAAFLADMLERAAEGEKVLTGKRAWEAERERSRLESFARARERAGPVPPKPATPRGERRWITCPHCGYHFSMTGSSVWDGEVHLGCGKPMTVVEAEHGGGC
ncbi:MAG TPA: SMI1/KNR4 family protein [Phycisphaerales bacterium]|nr:SMI1/KNR4 family protein [Phycisphaerales bacterium]